MTALDHIKSGNCLTCHQFIKILCQKFLLNRKVPSFGILHIDFPIVPNGNFLIAVGVFLVYGTKPNMFGGIEIQEEGAVFALLVLFFSILTGMLFNRNDGLGKNLLTGEEKKLVNKAIKESDNEVSPRVIVVKQEAEQKEEKNNQPDEYTPYYAYPPEYDYYDDYYEEEEEDGEDE